MRLILTAGYDRAPHVAAMLQMLQQRGHDIVGLIVVSTLQIKRFRTMVRQRGLTAVMERVRHGLGIRADDRSLAPTMAMDLMMNELEIPTGSLRRLARTRGIPYKTVTTLDHPRTVDFVKRASPDVVVYGGGGIVRPNLIQAARGMILNAHSGPLPQVRGMNALEWSLLLGEPPTVTVHFIDRGIDTGVPITVGSVPVVRGDTIETLRSKCTAIGVELMVSVLDTPLPSPDAYREQDQARQCFVLAPALRALLARRLAKQRDDNVA